MSLLFNRSCPICAGEKFQPFLTCIDHTTSHETFELQKCESCELILTNPRPDKESIAKYYDSDKYISHTGGTRRLIDIIYKTARSISIQRKRSVIEKNSIEKKILDIGCGTGELLAEMKKHNWNVYGIEPSALARKKAEAKIGKKIFEKIEEIEEANFDAVSLWHVLEHIHDLNETLQAIKTILKSSGVILIAVPNHEALDATTYSSFWAGYDVPRHLWHFSQNTMKKLLEQNGFSIIKIAPMYLDAFYVSILSENYMHPERAKFYHILKGILTGMKSNFRAKKNLNYSSLLYIAKK